MLSRCLYIVNTLYVCLEFFEAVFLLDLRVFFVVDSRAEHFEGASIHLIIPSLVFVIQGFIDHQFFAGFGMERDADDFVEIEIGDFC